MIVREDDSAAEEKLTCCEVAIFPRKVVIERERELCHVARRRALLRVRQSRGVAIDGVGHPELTRLCGHALGERRLAAGQSFGEHCGGIVGGFGDDTEDEVVHLHGIARYEVELGWALASRFDGDRQVLVEPKLASVQRFE